MTKLKYWSIPPGIYRLTTDYTTHWHFTIEIKKTQLINEDITITTLKRFFSAFQWCIVCVSIFSGCWDMKSESSTVLSFVEYKIDLRIFSLTNFTLHLISWNILLVMGYMRTFLLENRVLSSFASKTEFKLVYFSWNGDWKIKNSFLLWVSWAPPCWKILREIKYNIGN